MTSRTVSEQRGEAFRQSLSSLESQSDRNEDAHAPEAPLSRDTSEKLIATAFSAETIKQSDALEVDTNAGDTNDRAILTSSHPKVTDDHPLLRSINAEAEDAAGLAEADLTTPPAAADAGIVASAPATDAPDAQPEVIVGGTVATAADADLRQQVKADASAEAKLPIKAAEINLSAATASNASHAAASGQPRSQQADARKVDGISRASEAEIRDLATDSDQPKATATTLTSPAPATAAISLASSPEVASTRVSTDAAPEAPTVRVDLPDTPRADVKRGFKMSDGEAGDVGRVAMASTGTAFTTTSNSFESALAAAPSPAGATPISAGPTPAFSMNAMAATPPMIATPAEIVEIVQTKLSNGDAGDRLTVQLDPPELGRVAIDFKFDANGLQNITVTGETPEAMKQLRQLHAQLAQALEQHGLSSQDMTFRQGTSQQNQAGGSQVLGSDPDVGDDEVPMQLIPAATRTAKAIADGAGLNIKL